MIEKAQHQKEKQTSLSNFLISTITILENTKAAKELEKLLET